MYHTFNMGIGMVVVVSKNDADKALRVLKKEKANAYIIGTCKKSHKKSVIIG